MDKLYTCEELAERYKVKPITVWQWARDNKIPHIFISKRYYFKEEDVIEFEKARAGGCPKNPIPTA